MAIPRTANQRGQAPRVALWQARWTLIMILGFLLGLWSVSSLKVNAAEAPPSPTRVTPDQLDKSIDEVVQQREYTWRFPRDKAPYALNKPEVDLSFLERVGKSIDKAFQKIGGWIKDIISWVKFQPKSRSARDGGGIDWGGAMRILLLILVLALAGMIVFLLVKLWRERFSRISVESQAVAVPPAPDLQDEHVAADQLPENEWIVLARELVQQGEFRLALRAYYLASLAHLADRNLITIARFKSNRDYQRELLRRAHALPGLIEVFDRNVALFERVWYGMHDISAERVREFAAHLDQLKGGDVPA